MGGPHGRRAPRRRASLSTGVGAGDLVKQGRAAVCRDSLRGARRVRRWWVVPCAALLWNAAPADSQSRPLVIELFTSQGCSSCPPAEAYVGKLTARADVLALAFHVDYWDSLGWRDRFALPQAVERQNLYARNLHRTSVYTPQLVVDGQADALGSRSAALEQALGKPREGTPVAVSVSGANVVVEVGGTAPRRAVTCCWWPSCAMRFPPSAGARMRAARWRSSISCAAYARSDSGRARRRAFRSPSRRCPPTPPTWPCWCSHPARQRSRARRLIGCAEPPACQGCKRMPSAANFTVPA